MAGDRGLALVIIGLISVAALWRTASVAAVLPAKRPGGRVIEEVGRRMAADYRLFHEKLQSLAAMRDGSAAPPVLDAGFSLDQGVPIE